MSLANVTDLTVTTLEGRRLVDGVSFALEPGERLGLIGESGSGKSLSAMAITSLLPDGLTAHGSVELDGLDVLTADEADLRRLRGPVAAVVFQEPLTALDPLMRIGRQIAEPLRRHRGLRGSALDAAVVASLDEVSLGDPRYARAFPHELSGGQRQRVAIALALAAEPRLLIADEPTTALDVTVQAQVLALLDRLVREREMALLFISHDLAVVSEMTDRAVVLQHGHIVERGRLRDLLRDPQHPYTRDLVRSARALDDALGEDGAVR